MGCIWLLLEQDWNSHYPTLFTKFAGEPIFPCKKQGYLRQATKPNLRKQDLPTERLLCEDCENLFSQWENLFAETIFFPYVNERKLEFDYTDWLLKFSVSLIWRLGIAELEDFRSYQPGLVGDLEKALSVWRLYLLDNVPMKEAYAFHLLFLDFVKSVQQGGIPEGFHWYNLRAVDGTLPANEDQVYGFVKLPALVFFSGIVPRRPSKMKNTRIFERGKIRASNQIMSNPVFGEFFLNRAEQAWEMTKATSKKQQDKIRESIGSNPERSLYSQSFQVFLAEEYWKSKQKAG